MSPTPFDHIPVSDPGTPDLQSTSRFIFWIGKNQRRIILTGTFFGIVNLLCVALMPGILGRGIQSIADNRDADLIHWVKIALLIGVIQAGAGIMRHRRAVASWISAASRLQQLISRQAVHLGADLPRLVSTGEVSAINSNDVERVARIYDLIPRMTGAIISFIVVAILLITSAPEMGLMVVIAVPVLSLLIAPIIKPLQNRESTQRERLSSSSALAADIVAGLRILRGIGGERVFIERFRKTSQDVRAAAVKTAVMRALLDALQVLLPGALIVGVIWIGGRLVSQGDMKVGELLAFYGYSSFLMIPLQVLTESAQRITSGAVAARRVIRLLNVRPLHNFGQESAPSQFTEIRDAISGLSVTEGSFTSVVCDNSLTADELVDRLGGYDDPSLVTIDGAAYKEFTKESIRTLIYSQQKEPAILTGTIATHFAVKNSGAITIEQALDAASAQDVIYSLEGDGLTAEVVERGRTLSGGQRQRLALARTLFVDAPVTILDDPTSAVDAHTENRIAERMRELRQGRTTIVFTNSPLILDKSDHVVLLMNGKVAEEGRHSQLLLTSENYRRLVVRGS